MVAIFLSLTARQTNTKRDAVQPSMIMCHTKKLVSWLLASLLAAQHVSGSQAPEEGQEPERMFGHPIEEVPPAARTPIVIRASELKTLSAVGRLGDLSKLIPPSEPVQRAVGSDQKLRPQYFGWAEEKRHQLTLILRAMMEDQEFLECMAPCLNLPLAVLVQLPTRMSDQSLFFCGVKCQARTGEYRGITFPYIKHWLHGWNESPGWHDFTQDHAPLDTVAQPAQAVFGEMPAILHPHAFLHRVAVPYGRPLARLLHAWPSFERSVQRKMPALERKVVDGERRVDGL
ncbi:MAG: hypothetical protein M1826_003800 [Phylliscum demangeonii]|nr:MAG: hypothetical protein M1826_003800 [Phylliscum demangeonii]